MKRRSNTSSFNRKIPRANLGLKRDDPINYKDIVLMKKCVTPQGQILSRRRTVLSSKRQRELKRAVKHARHIAILPFVG